MDWGGWATFGLGATVALTMIMLLAQLGGLSRMDLPMMLGTMFAEDLDRARVVGFFVHLVNGQVFGLFYAAAFRSWVSARGGSVRSSERFMASPPWWS
jgi:hypothetical protein